MNIQAVSKFLTKVEDFASEIHAHIREAADWIDSASELERELLTGYRALKAATLTLLDNQLSAADVEHLLLEALRRELTPEAVASMAQDLARTVAKLQGEKNDAGVSENMQPPTDRAPPADDAAPLDLAALAQARAGGPPPVLENVEENVPSEPATSATAGAE